MKCVHGRSCRIVDKGKFLWYPYKGFLWTFIRRFLPAQTGDTYLKKRDWISIGLILACIAMLLGYRVLARIRADIRKRQG